MNLTSNFIFSPISDVSESFSEFSEVSHGGFNILLRAKRKGQWWMLKALQPAFLHDTTYQLILQKEYDLLSRLDHPGVVKVVGFEEVEDYGKCIVMEWIEGETLEEWLSGKHSRRKRRWIARQMMDAVEYVHEQQVVHRDLKPSNIMITRNGGQVKLIDFGLSDADSYAILKEPAGTDGYVAPEQQIGGGTLDERSDIYSLGVILEQMGLGLSYRLAARKCLQPLTKRYPDVLSMKSHILSLHRLMVTASLLFVFLVVCASGAWFYSKEIVYDVVNTFTIGNLEYKSWGGGLVTVCAANDRDSVIEIPTTVKYLGVSYRVDEVEDSAFAGHRRLKQVVLPDNPRLHVMKRVFDGSPNLSGICFRSKTPPQLGNAIWEVTMSDVFVPRSFRQVVLYVPKGSLSVYRNSPWGRFEHIEEYD